MRSVIRGNKAKRSFCNGGTRANNLLKSTADSRKEIDDWGKHVDGQNGANCALLAWLVLCSVLGISEEQAYKELAKLFDVIVQRAKQWGFNVRVGLGPSGHDWVSPEVFGNKVVSIITVKGSPTIAPNGLAYLKRNLLPFYHTEGKQSEKIPFMVLHTRQEEKVVSGVDNMGHYVCMVFELSGSVGNWNLDVKVFDGLNWGKNHPEYYPFMLDIAKTHLESKGMKFGAATASRVKPTKQSPASRRAPVEQVSRVEPAKQPLASRRAPVARVAAGESCPNCNWQALKSGACGQCSSKRNGGRMRLSQRT